MTPQQQKARLEARIKNGVRDLYFHDLDTAGISEIHFALIVSLQRNLEEHKALDAQCRRDGAGQTP